MENNCYVQPQGVCPTCGKCPTCGSYGYPQQPYVTWGTTTAQIPGRWEVLPDGTLRWFPTEEENGK